MSYEDDIALVLRMVDFSESSLVVTFLTEKHGKVGALAKGGRRIKGPFDSALDLLTLCRIVFLRKKTDVLDILTESKLVQRFRPTDRRLGPLYAGYYLAEMLDAMTEQYDPMPEVFDLAVETLDALRGGRRIAPIVARFEVGLLRRTGHMPSLSQCVGCGCQVVRFGEGPHARAGTARVPFAPIDGGVVCGRCRPGRTHVRTVSVSVLDVVRKLADADERLGRFDPTEIIDEQTWQTIGGELRGLLGNYMTHQIGRVPKMYPLLVPHWRE